MLLSMYNPLAKKAKKPTKKKFGVRTPGQSERAYKRALIPGYGKRKKKVGIFSHKGVLYNTGRRKTPFSFF